MLDVFALCCEPKIFTWGLCRTTKNKYISRNIFFRTPASASRATTSPSSSSLLWVATVPDLHTYPICHLSATVYFRDPPPPPHAAWPQNCIPWNWPCIWSFLFFCCWKKKKKTKLPLPRKWQNSRQRITQLLWRTNVLFSFLSCTHCLGRHCCGYQCREHQIPPPGVLCDLSFRSVCHHAPLDMNQARARVKLSPHSHAQMSFGRRGGTSAGVFCLWGVGDMSVTGNATCMCECGGP